jgi:hypothetical protein
MRIATRISMTVHATGLALLLASAAPPALAQDTQTRATHRRPPLRIEVTPPGRLYRQCTDWYVIEHRATGDTVVPRSRCVWAVR